MLLEGGILDVVHFWCNFYQLDVFQLGVEILNFLACVIDFVPLEFSRLQGLARGHGFVEVRAGRVDFFGKQERRVNTGAGQFASIVIGRDVQVVFLSNNFDASFAIFHIYGTLNVSAAIVFQPQINWDCHVLLLHFFS